MNLKAVYILDSRDKRFRASQDAKEDMNTKLGGSFQPDSQKINKFNTVHEHILQAGPLLFLIKIFLVFMQ